MQFISSFFVVRSVSNLSGISVEMPDKFKTDLTTIPANITVPMAHALVIWSMQSLCACNLAPSWHPASSQLSVITWIVSTTWLWGIGRKHTRKPDTKVLMYFEQLSFQIHLCSHCPACRTTFIATRFRVAVICPIIPVPHCIRVFFYFVWFVLINHIFQFYYELCTYCNILDIYLS